MSFSEDKLIPNSRYFRYASSRGPANFSKGQKVLQGQLRERFVIVSVLGSVQ